MKRLSHFAALVAFATLPLGAYAQEAPLYPSPQEALEALVAALDVGTTDAVISALGPDSAALMRDDQSTDRVEDWAQIVAIYRQGYRFVPVEDGRVSIELGSDGWPFPIELARSDEGWAFDIDSGKQEIVARLIGLNELDVIDILQAYVEIQRDFRQADHDGDGVLEFANSVISSAEARDGLYWPGDDSPVGAAAARASLDGFSENGTDVPAEPFFGYYFRLLNAQGPDAPGGAMDYVINGNQLAGHALLAVPAIYGETGTYSFLVGESGLVYEADLGEETLESALEITTYNPDARWRAME
ncbi:DUF2950 family protein [Aliiruegeria sabulilitoris]|uniref:DUF2950 family protein n=1 Tax=Aliiruegeria sabulilitoris TaxID=1510458 RepID=UPI00083554DE|nr:DUF2950 family protein [Aliiruegeria sabulilitoris]NDR56357.1 DUF2950 family protein [Pseudoruegeria sp. M32A2M]